MNLFPLACWDVCEDDEADAALVEWGHFLGACERPFGRQSFALRLDGKLAAVAVSASTVNGHCGGYRRREVVELVRLCSSPEDAELTRVALRLWRVTAPESWLRLMNRLDLVRERKWLWEVKAVVSYANALRHSGDIYRFDGWVNVGAVKGSTGGGTHSSRKKAEEKTVWAYLLDAAERQLLRERLRETA
jgi:hypothetical protein